MIDSSRIVFVTGGAGYIGSHVCKRLSEHGYIPVVYDNLSSGNLAAVKWGPLVKGDIRDRETLGRAMQQYKPSAIMHFAASIQVGASVKDPSSYYDNNVFGSFCLLDEARLHKINHMVFSSTAAVYGNPVTDLITENHPLAPINPYGQTKLTMENMIRDFSKAYGINHAILRYFNAAGADLQAEIGTAYKIDTHIIPLLMRVASNLMHAIDLYGTDYDTKDGTAIRDYIHVVDLAEAHVLALRHIMQKKQSLTLNLGTNKGTSVKNVIRAARAITGHAIPVLEKPRRAGDPAILVADATQARTALNWNPRYSDIETIVQTAWKWRQKQNRAETILERNIIKTGIPYKMPGESGQTVTTQ
jgi:UDP-arabinose 4-epimerase